MHLAIKTGKFVSAFLYVFLVAGVLAPRTARAAGAPEVKAEVDRAAIDPSGTIVLSVSVESQYTLSLMNALI